MFKSASNFIYFKAPIDLRPHVAVHPIGSKVTFTCSFSGEYYYIIEPWQASLPVSRTHNGSTEVLFDVEVKHCKVTVVCSVYYLNGTLFRKLTADLYPGLRQNINVYIA